MSDRADGCLVSSGDGESLVGVAERDELDELIAVVLCRVGDDTIEEPCDALVFVNALSRRRQ